MSISGVNGIGATAYAYMNSSMKTTGEGNFASEVQRQRKDRAQHQLPLHGRGIWLFRSHQIIVALHMIVLFPIRPKRK